MQEWRRQALGQVTLLKRYFRHAEDPMALWIELQMLHWKLCHDEDRFRLYGRGRRNREAIRQVWGYARWCYFRSEDQEVRDAVACAFYEHLALTQCTRWSVAFHLSEADFESLEDVFLYHLDTDVEYDRFRKEFYQTKANLADPAPVNDWKA